jgi:hypothetical protein
MNPEQDKLRARQAAQLLANPMLNEALDAIEKRCRDAWENSPPSAEGQRESAYMVMAGCKAFRGQLTAFLSRGKLADARDREQTFAHELARNPNVSSAAPGRRPVSPGDPFAR